MTESMADSVAKMNMSDKDATAIQGKAGGEGGAGKTPLKLDPPPEFIVKRQQLWNRLKTEHDDWLAAQVPQPIKITLPDGSVRDGESWRTTPYHVAAGISQGIKDSVLVAKVDGELWDLERPLQKSAALALLTFDDPDGQHVFWHSSAHVLGEAMECHYGGHLCHGSPVEGGFYCDMWTEDSEVISKDFPSLETLIKSIVKKMQPFERLEVKKDDLLKMFEYNKLKQRIIREQVTTSTSTVYKCGPFIELCRGPHVPHTGSIRAFAVTKNSSSYWEGRANAEILQRVYGVSFPDSRQLKEWKRFQEEAAKRDHCKIGRDQELFFFHELSPGSCFFLPKGAHIYNTLVTFIREEYWKRGFSEVVSPNIYSTKLWETFGYMQHYADNLFKFQCERETYALKQMNCPGHCLVFDHRPRSWRELPLRMADFGVLHRNEVPGALSGLTRTRRFQQDDAHVFCTPDQIKSEIEGCLDFVRCVYGKLNFTFDLKLSTRPGLFLGEVYVWDSAERQLSEALDGFGHKWELSPGDGAFYGPKIDIIIQDALRQSHQCATIQLDFQLPERFQLTYINDRGERLRPVIIHRAVLGSVERMMALLCENYAGNWPFWLSPRQAIVVPQSRAYNDYARKVTTRLREAGFLCDHDDVDPAIVTVNEKIPGLEMKHYNFILFISEKEVANRTVNVVTGDRKMHGEHTVDHVIRRFQHFRDNHTLDTESSF